MFSSSFFVAILASVHSFTFVAATFEPRPQITPAPLSLNAIEKRDGIAGGSGTPILSTLTYPYSALPEQVYPFAVLRGPQSGYNICNSTTQGPNSLCQTLIFNSIDDFCIWGSPTPNGTIGDKEAAVVAYCTKPIHGARQITPGAITGVQFVKTSAYLQVRGYIDNTGIGLSPTDSGGELDPHGADLQGNPLGGVVYSNSTLGANGLTQAMNWNVFVGGGQFCMKVCFNSITEPDYCQNTYDLIGCDYNMPSNVQNGTFTSCDSDLQDVVGIYSVNGVTSTYSMPATLLSPPPYTPRVPASSNCQTFQSTDIFLAASTSTSGTAQATGTNSLGSGSAGTGSGSGAIPTSTGASSSALSSIGVPPAFYALGLGIMAGVALLL
jgi:hypothetical protein